MTDQNLPDAELNVLGEEPGVLNDSLAPEALDPVTDGQPDAYPGAAENNPDDWREDPLLQGEPMADAGEEGELSDQTLRDGTEEGRYLDGAEQIPSEEPTIGEASADVDFGDPADGSEVDGSDDEANFGGSPLSQFDPEDLER